MEEVLITLGLQVLNTVLASTDPKIVAVAKQLTPQLKEVTAALIAAGYGPAATVKH